MELINATRMVAAYTQGLSPDGSEHLVVVIKGTFDFPAGNNMAELSGTQLPLVTADTFTGAPGVSAPVHESDYCLAKPHCDVLISGSAYAPNGRPIAETTVGLRVSSIKKFFDVIGDRTWSGRSGSPSEPKPFTVMPISYDRAFGGVDTSVPENLKAYNANPVGVGYRPLMNADKLRNELVPNTQEADNPVTNPKGEYRPMAFGPIGRSWPQRLAYAGSYDDAWMEDCFPFLPLDFDNRYFQAAPEDQQMPYPQGGELVSLANLTPEGRTDFELPKIRLPVEYTDSHFDRVEVHPVIDTVILEPDKRQFSLVWRTSFPLKRNMLEARQLVVGRMTKGWYRARATGKRYLVEVKRA